VSIQTKKKKKKKKKKTSPPLEKKKYGETGLQEKKTNTTRRRKKKGTNHSLGIWLEQERAGRRGDGLEKKRNRIKHLAQGVSQTKAKSIKTQVPFEGSKNNDTKESNKAN